MEAFAFRTVALTQLKESLLNPRKHFDPKKIDELAGSIKTAGIIEPLVVRPENPFHIEPAGGGIDRYYLTNRHGVHIGTGFDTEDEAQAALAEHGTGNFEIIAGARRYRAAKLAELEEAPVVVRNLSDEQALEIMVIENNQREDVNPLEEAEGYDRLLRRGYSIEKLSEKIGRSVKYVYDRLKLLALIPDAKQLLLTDRMTAGHAILLARLKPKQQEAAIDPHKFALFEGDHGHDLFDVDEEAAEKREKSLSKFEQKYDGLKARSVRELERWIDDHCRFDRAPQMIDQVLFPETSETIKKAVEEKEKVIQITHEHYVQPDAKEGNHERIYTERSWKLADGSRKEAKTCDKSVTGVIVVGPERGKAYKVCVHKECPVHWLPEKKKRERETARSAVSSSSWQKEQERQKAEQEKRQAERAAWRRAVPAMIDACTEKIKSADYGQLSEVLQRRERGGLLQARKHLSLGKSVETLAREVALACLIDECSNDWFAPREFPPRAKRLGIDVKAIVDAHMPKPKPEVQTSAKKAGKVIHALHGGTFDEPTCIHCGCQEMSPCPEGCAWAKLDKKTNRGLCTACKDKGHKWEANAVDSKKTTKAKKKPASKKKSASAIKRAQAAAAAG